MFSSLRLLPFFLKRTCTVQHYVLVEYMNLGKNTDLSVLKFQEVAYERNADGTLSTIFKKDRSPARMMPPAARNMSSPKTELGEEVKTGFLYPTIPAALAGRIGRNLESPPLDRAAMNALLQVKDKLTEWSSQRKFGYDLRVILRLSRLPIWRRDWWRRKTN